MPPKKSTTTVKKDPEHPSYKDMITSAISTVYPPPFPTLLSPLFPASIPIVAFSLCFLISPVRNIATSPCLESPANFIPAQRTQRFISPSNQEIHPKQLQSNWIHLRQSGNISASSSGIILFHGDVIADVASLVQSSNQARIGCRCIHIHSRTLWLLEIGKESRRRKETRCRISPLHHPISYSALISGRRNPPQRNPLQRRLQHQRRLSSLKPLPNPRLQPNQKLRLNPLLPLPPPPNQLLPKPPNPKLPRSPPSNDSWLMSSPLQRRLQNQRQQVLKS